MLWRESGSPQEPPPSGSFCNNNNNTCRNYERLWKKCHITWMRHVHNYARHPLQQHLDTTGMFCLCASTCTHSCAHVLFQTGIFFLTAEQIDTSRISTHPNCCVTSEQTSRAGYRANITTVNLGATFKRVFFPDERSKQRCLKWFSNSARAHRVSVFVYWVVPEIPTVL